MSISYYSKDLEALCNSSKLTVKLKYALISHSAHLTFIFRVGQSSRQLPLIGDIIGVLMEYFIRVFFSSDLSTRAKIDSGLCILHGHDIVIGADVKIGQKCKIFNGVTLGNKNTTLSSSGNQPTIANNVLISTGAKILGPVNIEDDVIIGANSVVIKSCEKGCTYVGVPARKI